MVKSSEDQSSSQALSAEQVAEQRHQRMNLRRADCTIRSEQLTVHDYQITLDLRTAADSPEEGFSTQSTIRFSAVPGSSTQCDFVGLAVQGVELNGQSIPVQYDGAQLQIPNLAAENVLTVRGTGEYSSSGEGLHRFVDPADGKVYLYMHCEPADARRVFANFEQPDLKARFQVEVLAPENWIVASNGATLELDHSSGPIRPEGTESPGKTKSLEEAKSPAQSWRFATTEPISTYLVCVIAGEYTKFSSRWEDPELHPAGMDLGIYCRTSQAEFCDASTLFELTRQGLSYFHRLFEYPYPFGKYDQAFVPEFNLGGMENPGLVTYTDQFIFTSPATDTQHQSRANVLLHEMAHMWFGDLVTMPWWDDLWLKESFADYVCALALDEATDWGQEAWVSFALRRKGWAYQADQLPSTHPIVADIPDLAAAKQNFDGITYAKGASVLKQLAAFLGQEAFTTAVRDYFRTHAFGTARLEDFLKALADASGRDMGFWAQQWLQTAGVSTLQLQRIPPQEQGSEPGSDEPKQQSLQIQQHSHDPITDKTVVRPHALRLASYRFEGQELLRTKSVTLELAEELTTLASLESAAVDADADLLLLNDEDLSYAKVRLDPPSLATVLAHLESISDPLARALCWSTLWNMTRDGLLPASAWLTTINRCSTLETNAGILTDTLTQSRYALERYADASARDQYGAQAYTAAYSALIAARPSSDEQLIWARHLISLSGDSYGPDSPETSPVDFLSTMLGAQPPIDLALSTELRWRILGSLAALGELTIASLDEELDRERNSVAVNGYHHALAARPTPEAKAAIWQDLTGTASSTFSSERIAAMTSGFQRGPEKLRQPYVERYFDAILPVWNQHTIEISSRILRGLFPHQDLNPQLAIEDHPVVLLTRSWLEHNPEAEPALQRILTEQLDSLLRDLSAQAADTAA